MLNPPPNYSEDNDFLLDVYRLPDDSVLYWRIIAYDLRSDFIWNISKRDSRLQTWQKYVLNSDFIRTELGTGVFSPVSGINLNRAYYFKIGNMVIAHIDFTADSTFTFDTETAISGNVFPLVETTTYSSLTSLQRDVGHCYIFKGTGIFSVSIPKTGRYIADFTYTIAK